MVETILQNFIVPNATRIEGIKCFTEIASLNLDELSDNE